MSGPGENRSHDEPDRQARLQPTNRQEALAVEAYERAPTLMAGEAPGAQGEIRIWAPDPAVIRRQALLGAAALILYFIMAFARESFSYPARHLILFLSIPLFGYWTDRLGVIPTLRRPRYLTTDNAGIGITTAKGTRYLKWTEIVKASEVSYASYILTVRTEYGEKTVINLSGHPPKTRSELLRMIAARSQLTPQVGKYGNYIRSLAAGSKGPRPITGKSDDLPDS